MIKQTVRNVLGHLGYEVHRIERPIREPSRTAIEAPAPLDPVWPLPRRAGGPSDEEIRQAFSKYDLWHYAHKFDGGLSFPARHSKPGPIDLPERPLQRYRHFMPYLLDAHGSLQGKRVLDIACNCGFWSIQCAFLGAEVVGFDARPELIEQANLIKSIVGLENVEFRVLDFRSMTPQSLGGTFDVVLSLGILYHLPAPLEALELTKAMAHNSIVLDTAVYPENRPMPRIYEDPLVRMFWEEPCDISTAVSPGIVAYPNKRAVELMLRHLGVRAWSEIPVRTTDMPDDYLNCRRISWLIKV